MYQIDLDVGTEFNKEYMRKVKEKLKSQYEEIKNDKSILTDRHKGKDDIIKENTTEIGILRKNIQYLEEANKLLTQDKIVASQSLELKTNEFYHQIERFIGSRIF